MSKSLISRFLSGPQLLRIVRILCIFLLAATGCGSERSRALDMAPPPEAPCTIAGCDNAIASTCPAHDVFLDCTSFGAACTDFTSAKQVAYRWCDCGTLQEGEGQCVGGPGSINAVICDGGMGVPATCAPGTICVADASGPNGLGCQCDNLSDGICPDPACSSDPDCANCTPSCGSNVCGDNGCNGSCGSCGVGATCSNGTCEASCVPDCTDKTCGDDGCGSSCGHCGIGQTCTPEGICTGATCAPNCAGYVCGSDGCNGSCGSCPSDLVCKLDGTACECDFFAVVNYTFDASDIDFADLFGVEVAVQHVNIDGSNGANTYLFLGGSEPTTKKFTAWGCRPNVRVSYTFYPKHGATCSIAQTSIVGQTTIVTPASCLDAPAPDMSTSAPDMSTSAPDMSSTTPFGAGTKIHYSGSAQPQAMALDVSTGLAMLFYATDDGTIRVLVQPPYATDAGSVVTSGALHITKMVANGNYLFWTYWDASLNAGGIRRVSSNTWPQSLPNPIVTGPISGLGVSDTHVFWIDSAGIHRMPAAGGTAALIVPGTFNGLAVHGSSLYYSNQYGGSIFRANLDGTSQTTFVSGESVVTELAAGTSHLAWSSATTVRAKAYAGSTVVTVATAGDYPLSIVTDDTSAFWTESNGHVIKRAPLAGGGPTTSFTSDTGDYPDYLLIDNTTSEGPTLYWDATYGATPFFVASKQIN